MQEPRLVTLEESFTVVGLQTRTNNLDEFEKGENRIAKLWEKFGKSSLMQHSNIQDPYIYGVYSNYVGDYTGDYIVTVGINKESLVLQETEAHEIIVQAGNYLVFETKKNMKDIVNTWEYIWQYFDSSIEPKRSYETDFEKYISDDKVEIYISVEDQK